MGKEIWNKIIIDDENTKYSISSYGNIRNDITGLILKPFKNHDDYLVITLYHKGKKYLRRINILVAKAFIPNPLNKPTVNHKDGIKTNNYVYNLEWATYSEQNIHAFKMGLMKPKVGEQSHYNKYPETTIHKICKLLEDGYDRKQVSEKLNVPKSLIKHIIGGGSWKHVSSLYIIDREKTKTKILTGSKSYYSKYSEETIREICYLLQKGKSRKYIKNKLNLLNTRIIINIQEGTTWKHISSQYVIIYVPHHIIHNKIKSSTTIKNLFTIKINIGE